MIRKLTDKRAAAAVLCLHFATPLAGCAAGPRENPAALAAVPAAQVTHESGEGAFLVSGVRAEYTEEREAPRFPLLAAEGLSTFPATARRITWFGKPSGRIRVELLTGSHLIARWYTPSGELYKEDRLSPPFPAANAESSLHVPEKMVESMSGLWRVEIVMPKREGEAVLDVLSFWLLQVEAGVQHEDQEKN